MKLRFQVFHPVFKIALLTIFLNYQASALLMPSTRNLTVPLGYQSSSSTTTFSQLTLYPNIETMGVVVTGVNLPNTATLMYRQSSETTWHTGQPLVRTTDGRLIGSLFGLSAATTYNVQVLNGSMMISASSTTQVDQLQFTPSRVLYANANAAPGGDGSSTAPYASIQQAINHAVPGTEVLVADGIYHETVSFPASGTAGNWIQVKAEGSGAILDGSANLTGNIWNPYGSYKHVWYMKIGQPIGYLARDQMRFYNYDSIGGLLKQLGHSNVPMSEGWYFQTGTRELIVRSLDDPSHHSWQVPFLNHAFDISSQDWIWIEGFEMRFYGTQLDGCGICAVNASHIVIRGNKIHNLQLGIYFNWTGGDDRGNDTRVENNEIYDPPVDSWPWAAVKGSTMEGTAIVVRGHVGAIVRGNDLHNFNNGIYTGSSGALNNPGVAFDSDIYDNYIHNIGDDALEPEGTNINERFRNNKTDTTLTGISLGPITEGPVWIVRNVFVNFEGTSIKWASDTFGIALIYQNTSWTNVSNLNAMSMITPGHNAVMRNNIFQGNGYSIYEATTGSTGMDWNYDDWYTTRSSSPHLKWENVNYKTMADLCAATRLECNGYEDLPGFTNPAGGDFTLLPSSPNIDRGVAIPGINDNFVGKAPDMGAFEYGYHAPPTVLAINRLDPNPTDATSLRFDVTFSESVSGVDVSDFALNTTSGITGTSIASVSGSGDTYTVTVNTGSGSGNLSLAVADNDSIVDASGDPLGGVGTGNGNFNAGDVYIVDRSFPVVSNIVRVDHSPTIGQAVRFTVTFSKPVTGVDASDFNLVTTGNIKGASVVTVAGVGNTYTVTAYTGSGDGNLGLDLVDDDSIVDASGNPLGGTGTGNGNFNSSEVYTLSRSTIPKLTQTFLSNGAYDGWILESFQNSGVGDSTNLTDTSFYLGDNAQNRQFRSILDFSTASLPDNAVIIDATLKIKRLSTTGADPFTTQGNILVDISTGTFGSRVLQSSDFQSAASLDSAGTILNSPVVNWYATALDLNTLPYINAAGTTQFRLRFQESTDYNAQANTIKFDSGDAATSNRPTLQVDYYIP